MYVGMGRNGSHCAYHYLPYMHEANVVDGSEEADIYTNNRRQNASYFSMSSTFHLCNRFLHIKLLLRSDGFHFAALLSLSVSVSPSHSPFIIYLQYMSCERLCQNEYYNYSIFLMLMPAVLLYAPTILAFDGFYWIGEHFDGCYCCCRML